MKRLKELLQDSKELIQIIIFVILGIVLALFMVVFYVILLPFFGKERAYNFYEAVSDAWGYVIYKS